MTEEQIFSVSNRVAQPDRARKEARRNGSQHFGKVTSSSLEKWRQYPSTFDIAVGQEEIAIPDENVTCCKCIETIDKISESGGRSKIVVPQDEYSRLEWKGVTIKE